MTVSPILPLPTAAGQGQSIIGGTAIQAESGFGGGTTFCASSTPEIKFVRAT